MSDYSEITRLSIEYNFWSLVELTIDYSDVRMRSGNSAGRPSTYLPDPGTYLPTQQRWIWSNQHVSHLLKGVQDGKMWVSMSMVCKIFFF